MTHSKMYTEFWSVRFVFVDWVVQGVDDVTSPSNLQKSTQIMVN